MLHIKGGERFGLHGLRRQTRHCTQDARSVGSFHTGVMSASGYKQTLSLTWLNQPKLSFYRYVIFGL